MKYAEIAKFADISWRQLNGPGGYEVMDSYDLNANTTEYQEYRQKLWPLAVEKTVEGFKRVLLEEDGMAIVFQAIDTLSKAIQEAPAQGEELLKQEIHDMALSATLYHDPHAVLMLLLRMFHSNSQSKNQAQSRRDLPKLRSSGLSETALHDRRKQQEQTGSWSPELDEIII